MGDADDLKSIVGYSTKDQVWKSTDALIRKLVHIVSKGGNLPPMSARRIQASFRKNPLYAWRKSVNGLREMERRSTAQAQARSRMSWNGERLR